MDGLGQTIGRPLAPGELDEARDLSDREPRRIEPLPRRYARDLGEQAHPWVTGRQLTLTVDGQHHDAGVGQVHRHEPEQQQRWLVGGVEIVEDQDNWTVAGRVSQQSRERIKQLEASAIGVIAAEIRQLRENVTDLRQDLRDVRSVGSDQPSKVVRLDVPQE